MKGWGLEWEREMGVEGIGKVIRNGTVMEELICCEMM